LKQFSDDDEWAPRHTMEFLNPKRRFYGNSALELREFNTFELFQTFHELN